MRIREFIDLEAYPIDPCGAVLKSNVAAARESLARDGCAVLSGFLTQAGFDALTREADDNAPQAHRIFNRTNAYFTQDGPSLSAHYSKRQFFERSNAVIPSDHFVAGGALRSTFQEPGFATSIKTCLPETAFFR